MTKPKRKTKDEESEIWLFSILFLGCTCIVLGIEPGVLCYKFLFPFYFETVAQNGLKIVIPLSQSPKLLGLQGCTTVPPRNHITKIFAYLNYMIIILREEISFSLTEYQYEGIFSTLMITLLHLFQKELQKFCRSMIERLTC